MNRRHFVKQAGLALAASTAAAQRSATAPNNDTERATRSDLAAIPVAEADPSRPLFHFHPPANHMNDPNGTLFFNGWHHLFYQHDPFAPKWGSIHWGHARSRDLVNWEHLPIALAPSANVGETQCFSGGAIVAADGRPRIVYTSIGRGMPLNPEQWLALPSDNDLFVWTKYAGNPVMAETIHGAHRVEDWRDPFLFRHGGEVYAVCGGNSSRRERGGTGEVLLYRASRPDLTQWTFLRVIFRYRSEDVINIECPNLFPLDGRWVLIISPHRSCEYFVGDFDPAAGEFRPETHGVVDPGKAYATNISFGEGGRVILWIWGQAQHPESHGWLGCAALPRTLSLSTDGFLRQQPAPEFNTLRQQPLRVEPFALHTGTRIIDGVSGECLEIEAEISAGNAKRFGFELRRSAAGKAGLVVAFQPTAGSLQVGDIHHIVGRKKSYKVRLFLDRCAIEIFVDDGESAIFATTLAAPQDQGLAFFSEGSDTPSGDPYFPDETTAPASVTACTVWPMRPAAFDRSRLARGV